MNNPRHEEILQYIKKNGYTPISKLAVLLNVTSQTIRRDISILEKEEKVRRHHGGVSLLNASEIKPYEERKEEDKDVKEQIAKEVVEYISEGETLFLASGTSIEAVAEELVNKQLKNLTIITNNINVGIILTQQKAEDLNWRIIITPGTLNHKGDGCLTGISTNDFIKKFKVGKAIVGAASVDIKENEVFEVEYREASAIQEMMKNARESYLIVSNNTKFDRPLLVRVESLSKFNMMFVTKEVKQSDEIMSLLKKYEKTYIICPRDTEDEPQEQSSSDSNQ